MKTKKKELEKATLPNALRVIYTPILQDHCVIIVVDLFILKSSLCGFVFLYEMEIYTS